MTFDSIYRSNAWAGVETRSGPGSGMVPTRFLAHALTQLVEELGITSVVDAACGEGLWQPDLPNYLGLDISEQAIEVARTLHPDRKYLVHDIRGGCPQADLVICRDAMQHVSLGDGLKILNSIVVQARAKWVLVSTYVGTKNIDVEEGSFYSPNLEALPFDLPAADRLYHDGFSYHEPGVIRDPLKMMGLWYL